MMPRTSGVGSKGGMFIGASLVGSNYPDSQHSSTCKDSCEFLVTLLRTNGWGPAANRMSPTRAASLHSLACVFSNRGENRHALQITTLRWTRHGGQYDGRDPGPRNDSLPRHDYAGAAQSA